MRAVKVGITTLPDGEHAVAPSGSAFLPLDMLGQ